MDTVHTSKRTTETLKMLNVETLYWPSNSGDCNPIESCWMLLKKRIQDLKFSSNEEFQNQANKVWKSMDKKICSNLVLSMKRRVMSLIDNNGGNIKY